MFTNDNRTFAWLIATFTIVVAVISFAVVRNTTTVARHDDKETVAPHAVPSAPSSVESAAVGLDDDQFNVLVATEVTKLDAATDGWDSEVFSESCLKQLKRLGSRIALGPDTDVSRDDLFGAHVGGSALRPHPLVSSFDDGTLRVMRQDPSRASRHANDSSDPANDKDVMERLDDLREAFPPKSTIDVHFKIVGVTVADDMARTEVLFTASADRVAQSATWACQWDISQQPPRLTSIDVKSYEETNYLGPTQQLFKDATANVAGEVPKFRQQWRQGVDHWRSQLDQSLGTGIGGYQGLAVGDVNGDGLEDVYVCQPGGLPNGLFLQQSNGQTVEVATDAGVDILDLSRMSLLIDVDNDGDQDLVLAANRRVLFFENVSRQPLRFALRDEFRAASQVYAIAAADYDLDGDLDLYVGCYGTTSGFGGDTALGFPIPYHDANNGAPNALLRNDSSFKFVDVTNRVGLNVNNQRFSQACSWEDFDNDGDPDIYVANDFGRNNLYRNDAGQFIDTAAESGVEDISAGMSVGWGDYNQDGLMDLYVSNMFSSAGNRIAFQRQFKADADDDARQQFQRHARGNSLFQNLGDGTFRDVSEESSVTMGRWAWSSNFVDINNDGWEDIFVANGFMTGKDSGDL